MQSSEQITGTSNGQTVKYLGIYGLPFYVQRSFIIKINPLIICMFTEHSLLGINMKFGY